MSTFIPELVWQNDLVDYLKGDPSPYHVVCIIDPIGVDSKSDFIRRYAVSNPIAVALPVRLQYAAMQRAFGYHKDTRVVFMDFTGYTVQDRHIEAIVSLKESTFLDKFNGFACKPKDPVHVVLFADSIPDLRDRLVVCSTGQLFGSYTVVRVDSSGRKSYSAHHVSLRSLKHSDKSI